MSEPTNPPHERRKSFQPSRPVSPMQHVASLGSQTLEDHDKDRWQQDVIEAFNRIDARLDDLEERMTRLERRGS